MTNMNHVFKDFADADPNQASGGGSAITVHGVHEVEIVKVRFKESDQYDAVYLIVEFKVLKTNHDSVTVGSEYGWAHNMLNKWYGASNTKQFIASALGMDPGSAEAKAITREVVEEAWGESQPLAGEVVKLKTTPKVSKAGNDFTVHAWSPIAEAE
jgi:hypothetical protein